MAACSKQDASMHSRNRRLQEGCARRNHDDEKRLQFVHPCTSDGGVQASAGMPIKMFACRQDGGVQASAGMPIKMLACRQSAGEHPVRSAEAAQACEIILAINQPIEVPIV